MRQLSLPADLLDVSSAVSSQVLSGVDELFERDELSAAPDAGWPDCFNSGVFVFRPSLRTHARLLDRALQHGSFDGNARMHVPRLNTFTHKGRDCSWLMTIFLE